jgi:hypothetical protein
MTQLHAGAQKYHRKRSKLSRSGTCPLCDTYTKLVADHCHTTGLLRDPLCRKCNMALGLFADSADRLRLAATYLERHAAAHQQYRDRP